VSKLTGESDANNPKWVVALDDDSSEETVNESELGEILGKASEETVKKVKKPKRSAGRNNGKESPVVGGTEALTAVNDTTNVAKQDSRSTGSQSSNEENKKKRPAPSSQDGASDSSGSPSDAASSKKARATAREQRSRRRQAMMEEVDNFIGTSSNHGSARGIGKPRPTNNKKKKDDPDLVKIPMLTGTLILYRGVRRRAEFVRKY